MTGTVLPILRQCCYTPLRDVLRAQLTGRLDWKRTLRESDLPVIVQSTIQQVVQKSRLTRTEKAEVCDELIAHFEDGQQSGQSFQQLIRDFGDLDVAASLIRRSKKRNRSVFAKSVRAAGYLGLGAIVGYLLLAVYVWMGRANPHTDFLVKLNQTASEATDENQTAWPIYRETWIRHHVLNHQKNQRLRDIYATRGNGNIASGHLLKPDDAEWPKAVSLLRDYQEMLAAYREAGKRPRLGLELKTAYTDYERRDLQAMCPHLFDESGALLEETIAQPDFSGPPAFKKIMDGALVGILLPHVQEFRGVANLLTVDTRLAIEEDDSERAIENMKTIFAVAGHASESPILVCGVVSLAIDSVGFDLIAETLTEHPDFLSQQQLAELQSLLVDLPIREQIKIEGERAMVYDLIQRVYTDDGKGDGRLTVSGATSLDIMRGYLRQGRDISDTQTNWEVALERVSSPVSVLTSPSRKQVKRKYDELMDLFEQSLATPVSMQASPFEDSLAQTDTEQEYRLLGAVLPAARQIRNAMECRLTRRDAIVLALAAARFRNATGQFPKTAEELVPEFIDGIPMDPLTGGSMGFRSEDGQLKIYSVGSNLKDDGGAPMTEAKSGKPADSVRFYFQSPEIESFDGDWILWSSGDP